jgi:thiol-disulfide isomerase/thioredoxin
MLMLLRLLTILCGGCWASFATAAEPNLRMRLKDGSFGSGAIVGVAQPDQLGWKSDAFEQPFQLDVRAVRSVTQADETDEQTQDTPVQAALPNPDAPDKQPEYLFEMLGGSLVVGQLASIDANWITVRTKLLGEVQLARTRARAIVDADYAGQIVYAGPLDDDHWQRLTEPGDWEFEGGALVATKQGAAVVGNVELPPQAQIKLSMSWRGAPDFVLSLGTLASNKVSKVTEVPSAARIEVWANQLALVREVDGGADIAMLSDLSGANPRIDLTIYLDQQAGTVIVCDTHGRPLETLQVPSDKSIARPAVHLTNEGPSLTLEHFEVRQWDGIASTLHSNEYRVLTAQGQNLDGSIVGYDPDQRALEIQTTSGEKSLLPLSELRRGDFAVPTNAAQDGSPGAAESSPNTEALPPAVVQPPQLAAEDDGTAANQPPATSPTPASPKPLVSDQGDLEELPTAIEVILSDRTRLSGTLLSATQPDRIRFASYGLSQAVEFPADSIRGIIGSAARFVPDDGEEVVGTLKMGDCQLAGFLDQGPSAAAPADSSGLFWHPSGSTTASALSQSATGAIIYRKRLPQAPPPAPVARADANRQRNLVPAPGMFLGNNSNSQDTSAIQGSPADPTAPAAREIMFRTGDAIDGLVERIDEQGMTFRSAQSDTSFAPHALIQHVWLNPTRSKLPTSPEKLKRLMTVPRSMKQDPPTHLFVAISGDYLRGRLVSLDNNQLTVEIRLEQLQIATSQISQIIWLHDRDWSDKPQAVAEDSPPKPDANEAEAEPQASSFLVHAIGRSDRGLTFRPEKFKDGILSGRSDLLGECSVVVGDLNQLLFGRSISQQIREYRDDPWTLSLAQFPRVYIEDGADPDAPAGSNSPMVGQPAPEFLLRTLLGEDFRLSNHHDRIVVLDFWASWCGPCIQTMPLVDQVVNELGPDKIHLVAVNIQETPARVLAAVERLGLNATTLLDVDGQVAAAYAANAIPQTVIIDRQGMVTHVFVGGGPKFVGQFRQALQAMTGVSPVE